eukprot:3348143-Alexandrium_andersonii.AAC.1
MGAATVALAMEVMHRCRGNHNVRDCNRMQVCATWVVATVCNIGGLQPYEMQKYATARKLHLQLGCKCP